MNSSNSNNNSIYPNIAIVNPLDPTKNHPIYQSYPNPKKARLIHQAITKIESPDDNNITSYPNSCFYPGNIFEPYIISSDVSSTSQQLANSSNNNTNLSSIFFNEWSSFHNTTDKTKQFHLPVNYGDIYNDINGMTNVLQDLKSRDSVGFNSNDYIRYITPQYANTSSMVSSSGYDNVNSSSNWYKLKDEIRINPGGCSNVNSSLSSEAVSSCYDFNYREMKEKRKCDVCGDVSAGFHCSAFVCEACKKFFIRSSKGESYTKYSCTKSNNCEIVKDTRTHCQFCRFQKCLRLGMTLPGTSITNQNTDISQIPCRVCGAQSSGFHFGAITCEGCKGFFRRTINERENQKYTCRNGGICHVNLATRNNCKSCRYKKCLGVGMSKEGSRIGRQPNAVKHMCAREIEIRALGNGTSAIQGNSSASHHNYGSTAFVQPEFNQPGAVSTTLPSSSSSAQQQSTTEFYTTTQLHNYNNNNNNNNHAYTTNNSLYGLDHKSPSALSLVPPLSINSSTNNNSLLHHNISSDIPLHNTTALSSLSSSSILQHYKKSDLQLSSSFHSHEHQQQQQQHLDPHSHSIHSYSQMIHPLIAAASSSLSSDHNSICPISSNNHSSSIEQIQMQSSNNALISIELDQSAVSSSSMLIGHSLSSSSSNMITDLVCSAASIAEDNPSNISVDSPTKPCTNIPPLHNNNNSINPPTINILSVNTHTNPNYNSSSCSNSNNPAVKFSLDMPLHKFISFVNVAASYLNNTQRNFCSQFNLSFDTEECFVWDVMMQHFHAHAIQVIKFAKNVPGFRSLCHDDMKVLYQEGMYPIILVQLSRDFNIQTEAYNYFNFSPQNKEVILSKFSIFHKIADHVKVSGKLIKPMELDETIISLICYIELVRGDSNSICDRTKICQMYQYCVNALRLYMTERGCCPDKINTVIDKVLPCLSQMTLEHQEAVMTLRTTKPTLKFPNLYAEMFLVD